MARPLPGQPPRLMVANREQTVSVDGGLGEKASSWRPSTFLSSLPVAIADTATLRRLYKVALLLVSLKFLCLSPPFLWNVLLTFAYLMHNSSPSGPHPVSSLTKMSPTSPGQISSEVPL